VIPHTGNFEPSLRDEAFAIGVPLLDKMAAPTALENVLRNATRGFRLRTRK
jgi:hypothetical protein